jgi:hypothetical protein
MPVANFVESVVFYDDVENASNPVRKHVDWKRSATGLVFEQVYSERFVLSPGASRTVASPVGVTDLSATAVAFGAAIAKPSWYQVRGAFPTSPWALALAVGSASVTVTANTSDGSAFVSGAGLASLAGVKPGDWVYLAGSTYGDAGAFAPANQGFWLVSAVSTGLHLFRVYSDDSAPVTETVTTVGTTDIQHLPDATRPRWAYIAGSTTFGGLKSVVAAAIGWVAIATETQFITTGATTLSRLVVTPNYISYARVESDKSVKLTVGDAAAVANEVTLLPVGTNTPAWFETFSFSTSLALLNTSNASATINIIYAIAKTAS